jgi:hypothetical protein
MEHAEHMRLMRITYRYVAGKPEGRGRLGVGRRIILKSKLMIECENVQWIPMAHAMV